MSAPTPDGHGNGVPAWGDAGVICPWTIYQVYGDKRILERHLPAMMRWVEWCRAHSTDLIRDNDRGTDYGDWLSIGADTPKGPDRHRLFRLFHCICVAKSCRAVGDAAHAAKYEQLFEDIKAAFNKRYVAADGRIQGDTQCGYAMALKIRPAARTIAPQGRAISRRGHQGQGWPSDHRLRRRQLPAAGALTQAGKLDTAYASALAGHFPFLALLREARRDHHLGTLGRLDAGKGLPGSRT